MEPHTLLNDEAFEVQFETCMLDPALFTHEAHLRLAWIHIKKYGVETAVEHVVTQLSNFVAHAGARDKFNLTLTIAAVRGVNHFMLRATTDTFPAFIKEFPQLLYDFKALIDSHYSCDIFKEERAKTNYLVPDLAPFE